MCLISSDCRLLIAEISTRINQAVILRVYTTFTDTVQQANPVLTETSYASINNMKNIDIDQSDWLLDFASNFYQKSCFHLHWHSVVKLLHGLVVDGYGHLSVSVEGELYVVAGPVLPRCLVTRQLQVFTAPTGGGGQINN